MRVGMSLQLQLVMIPLVENVRVIRRGRKLQSPWWRCSIVGYVIALVTYPIMSLLYPQYIYIYLLFIYLFIIIYIYTVHIHVYMHILLIIYPYYIPILSPVYCIWQTPGMEQLLAPPILPSLAAVTTESMRCWNTQKHIICWYVLIWFFFVSFWPTKRSVELIV